MIKQIKILPKLVFFDRFPSQRVACGLEGDSRGFNPVACLWLGLEDNDLFPLILLEGRDAKEGEEKTEKKKLKETLGEEKNVEPHAWFVRSGYFPDLSSASSATSVPTEISFTFVWIGLLCNSVSAQPTCCPVDSPTGVWQEGQPPSWHNYTPNANNMNQCPWKNQQFSQQVSKCLRTTIENMIFFYRQQRSKSFDLVSSTFRTLTARWRNQNDCLKKTLYVSWVFSK